MCAIYKLCERQYSLSGDTSEFRLQTLRHYREDYEVEDPCSDRQEATTAIAVHHAEPGNTSPDVARVLERFVGPGASVSNSRFQSVAPNRLVFCCVIAQDGQLPWERFPKYDASYRIPDPNVFAEATARELLFRLTPSAIETAVWEQLSQMPISAVSGLGVSFRHGPVFYTDSVRAVQDGRWANDVPIDDPVFTKAQRFAWQREYRFEFALVAPAGRVLPMKKESVALPAAALQSLVTAGPVR